MSGRLVLAIPLGGLAAMLIALGMMGAINMPTEPVEVPDEPRKVVLSPAVFLVCGCTIMWPTLPRGPEARRPGDLEIGTPDAPQLEDEALELPPFEPDFAGRAFSRGDPDVWQGFAWPRGWEECLDVAPEGGRVRLRYDIDPQGETRNVSVVFSTHACFEVPGISAIEETVFPPTVRNGEAVWQYAVESEFVFTT